MHEAILPGLIKQFQYYKNLGDKTFQQLGDDQMHWQYNEDSNSPAILIKHISGNMLSRFTNFLTEDGEKTWRNRDAEFEGGNASKEVLLKKWDEGWSCLFGVLESLSDNDLDKMVYIRNMGHTVFEALNRQLAHYAYHVGQIVFIGKMLQATHWQSLSIPRGESEGYNKKQFGHPRERKHFTDDFLKGEDRD